MSVCVFAGECVLALKSMTGSTALLSHRSEETGNIHGNIHSVTIFMGFPAERPVQKQPLCLGLSKYTTLFWCLKAQRALPVNFEFVFLSYFDLSIIYVTGRWKLAPRGGKRRRQTPLTNTCFLFILAILFLIFLYIYCKKQFHAVLCCVVVCVVNSSVCSQSKVISFIVFVVCSFFLSKFHKDKLSNVRWNNNRF